MLYWLCSGLVELNVILQVQHINNNKYNNSFKENAESTLLMRTAVCVKYSNVKDIRSQFIVWNEMQIDNL